MNNGCFLTEDNTRYILQRIWKKLFFPSLWNEIGFFIYASIGAFFMISRYGTKEDLIIFTAFSPYFMLSQLIDCFFTTGASNYFSFCKGEKDNAKAQNVFSENLTSYCTIVLGILLLLIWQTPLIVKFMKIPSALVATSIVYGRWFMVSLLVTHAANMLRGFLSCDSFPRYATTVSLLASLAILAGVVVSLGFLKQGIYGYIGVMIVVNFLSLFFYLIPYLAQRTTVTIKLKWMTKSTLGYVFSISSGQGLLFFLLLILGVIINRWMFAFYGGAAVAIAGLCSIVERFSSITNHAYMNPAMQISSMLLGERNYKGIRIFTKRVMIEGIAIKILLVVLILITAEWIVKMLPVQENWQGEAAWAIRIFSFGCISYFPNGFLSKYYGVCNLPCFQIFGVSIPQQMIRFFLAAFFFFVVRSEKFYWFVYPALETFSMIYIVVIAEIYRRRHGFRNFLMEPKHVQQNICYYFLMSKDNMEFDDYRKMLILFLKQNQVADTQLSRGVRLFEELFLFAREKCQKGDQVRFAIKTELSEQKELLFSLWFESSESKLERFLYGRQYNMPLGDVVGAKLLKELADSVYIDRIYGLYYLTVRVNPLC